MFLNTVVPNEVFTKSEQPIDNHQFCNVVLIKRTSLTELHQIIEEKLMQRVKGLEKKKTNLQRI